MSTDAPALFRPFWRSRRAAAIAGILFGVLLLTAMVMTRSILAPTSTCCSCARLLNNSAAPQINTTETAISAPTSWPSRGQAGRV